jgi:hypothetical protein
MTPAERITRIRDGQRLGTADLSDLGWALYLDVVAGRATLPESDDDATARRLGLVSGWELAEIRRLARRA